MSSRIHRVAICAVGAAVLIGMVVTNAQVQGRYVRLAPIPEASEEYDSTVVERQAVSVWRQSRRRGRKAGSAPGSGVRVRSGRRSLDEEEEHAAARAPQRASWATTGRSTCSGAACSGSLAVPTQFPIANSWEYDPAADSWRALAPLPLHRVWPPPPWNQAGRSTSWEASAPIPGWRTNHSAANSRHRVLDTNQVYDPATNTWQTRQTMPTAA